MSEPAMERRMLVGRDHAARQRALFALCLLVLVAAPLVMGGNRPLPLLGLEIAALGMLLLSFGGPWIQAIPRLLLAALVLLCALPFLQLIPVPPEFWSTLPGRAGYALWSEGAPAASTWRAMSIAPVLTEYAAWALLPPVAVFVAALNLTPSRLRAAVWVFLAMVLGQAVLGLMQYGDGPGSWLRFGPAVKDGSAVGTFPNRNLLAGMLVMGLPVLLALLASSVFGLDRLTARGRTGRNWFRRVRDWGRSESGSNRSLLYGAMTLAVLLAIVFTRSRSGIALAMLGLVTSVFVIGRNLGGRFSARIATVMVASGLSLAVAIGLAPVLARFGADPLQDTRWLIFAASWEALKEFFPLGSGFGTYPEVIAARHPSEFGGEFYINHAHNDYLEWWVEGGLIAILLTIFFGLVYLWRWRTVWAERNWKTLHMMQVGAGIGMLLLMLHGVTDFNFRVPSNALYFAFLAGVFFYPIEDASLRAGRRYRIDVRKSLGDAGSVKVADGDLSGRGIAEDAVGLAPTGGRRRNPFSD